ncbi:MAG: hypothetical protein HXS46_16190 [Theionarchaea archaeon]|nr:hypothetical protein [Theionarchaea archaeon]
MKNLREIEEFEREVFGEVVKEGLYLWETTGNKKLLYYTICYLKASFEV